MRICSFLSGGSERTAVMIGEDSLADLSLGCAAMLSSKGESGTYQKAASLAPKEMSSFLVSAETSLETARKVQEFLTEHPESRGPKGERLVHSLKESTLLAPVRHPGKVVCGVLGMLEKERVRKWGNGQPLDHPIFFLKSPSSIIGPGEAIDVPEVLTWPEVELSWIIGRRAKTVDKEEWLDCVLGFSIFNDVTAGGLHADDTFHVYKEDGTEDIPFRVLSRYKSFDTFGPLGPWIVTKDELRDPEDLRMRCWVDDTLVTDGRTTDLRWRFSELTAFASEVFTLQPGDVFAGGTCKAAVGRKLADADLRSSSRVTCEIEGVGRLENPIRRVNLGLSDRGSGAMGI